MLFYDFIDLIFIILLCIDLANPSQFLLVQIVLFLLPFCLLIIVSILKLLTQTDPKIIFVLNILGSLHQFLFLFLKIMCILNR